MGLAPDLRHLDYLGRAITPPDSPIRFHARFLVADAEHARGELGGSGELLNLHWLAIDEAVRRKRPLFRYRNNQALATYS
jgi:8-oxo-dGTP pyrophosphatase MutT (NUDIX family)